MTLLPRQPISIVGGGLSGLALGILLRRQGILVELFESHAYPHHRVCGEFISGLRPGLIEDLGIADLLQDAHHHRQTSWHSATGETFHRFRLPRSAAGLSRHTLDARLVERFCELGGTLVQHRWRDYERLEKVIYTTGRRPSSKKTPPKWIGLKLHARHFSSDSDLEMHLGHGGYVGATAVEDGITNLCGLFPIEAFQASQTAADTTKSFESALSSIGLHQLRDRLAASEVVTGSRCGTTHFQPGQQAHIKQKCCLGDAQMQIPPFTGHGMAMALESAWIAHTHLVDYVNGTGDWTQAVTNIRQSIKRQHAMRVSIACKLHPFMLQGRLPQYWKYFGAVLNLLPPRLTPLLWGQSLRTQTSCN